MYDKITAELDELHKRYLSAHEIYTEIDMTGKIKDGVNHTLAMTYIYNETDEESQIPTDTVDEFIASGYKMPDGDGGTFELPEQYQKIVKAVNDALKKDPLSGEEIEKLLDIIADTESLKPFTLAHPITKATIITLRSPEDKLIAADTIKKFRSQYLYWHTRVLRAIRAKLASGEFDHDTIKKLLDEVK
jgi:chorismate mutase